MNRFLLLIALSLLLSGCAGAHGSAGANNVLSGNGGNDTLMGGLGDDTLSGGNGDDYLDASSGNNTLNGGEGNDTLISFIGSDVLNGGGGSDTLYGGAGADTFIFDATALSGKDTVLDFNPAQGDKLELLDILEGYDPMTSAINDFVQISDSGANSCVDVDADGTLNGSTWTQIVQLNNITGLTDETKLLTDHTLLIA